MDDGEVNRRRHYYAKDWPEIMSAPADLDIYTLAEIHRQAVIAREQPVVDAIVDAYRVIAAEAERQLDDLMAQVAAHVEAGNEVSQSWLRRQETLERLLDTVERQVRRISRDANGLITNGQRDMVALGETHAQQLMLNGMGPAPAGVAVTFNRMNPRAVEALVGFLSPGTPLSDALDRLPGMASSDVRKALLEGIGLGRNPRRVALDMRLALGGNIASAEKLARTTMLNVYRESTLETYRENADIVTGWRWVAALDDDATCLSCIEKHGQVFPLEETLRDHWNGRCSAVAETKSWSELGFEGIEDTQPVIETGEDWFMRQSESVQRNIMGRSKYHAWKAGDVKFGQFSKAHNDPVFGKMYSEATLKELLGAERAKEWYARAAAIERGEFDVELPLAAD